MEKKQYKGISYEIHFEKLRDRPGYEAYGMVFFDVGGGTTGKILPSEGSKVFYTREEAENQLDHEIKKHIEENIL